MTSDSDVKTLRNLMDRSLEQYRDLPAIAFAGEPSLTYGELAEQVEGLARLLLQQHVRPGERVALLGDNSPNWVIAYLATIYFGAVVVPILPGFPDADIRHIIRNAEAVAIFVTAKLAPKLEDLERDSLHTIIDLEDFAILESGSGIRERAKQLLHKKEPQPRETIPAPAPSDLAAIIYTSGTTGHSKGVMLTHENITFDVVQSIEKFPISSSDRFLSILPLSHTFEATGGMLCPLAVGVNIHYLNGLPTPEKLLSAMRTVQPTAVLMVPLVIDKIYRKRILPQLAGNALFRRLLRVPFTRRLLHKIAGRKLMRSLGGKLRFFMFGGASLNNDVEQFLRDAAISYSTGYGLTETSPIVSINPFGCVKTGSCGQAIPGVDLKIADPDPETGVGEILVRGANVMQGYFSDPEATAAVLGRDGWFRTGDLGYLDQQEYLYIKGRCKNVIVGPSGENIYPEIIEGLLQKNSYVQEAVVYQEGGRLAAKAYLDYDVLDQEFQFDRIGEAEGEKLTQKILDQVRAEINAQLPAHSGLSVIYRYPQPFEKTPTNKVKRYLYTAVQENASQP